MITVNAPILEPWIARHLRAVTNKTGLSKKSTKDYDDPSTGSHQLTRIERRQKQNRIRMATGLTTLDNDSEERIVKDYDPHARNNETEVSIGSAEVGDRVEIQVTRAYNVSKQDII